MGFGMVLVIPLLLCSHATWTICVEEVEERLETDVVRGGEHRPPAYQP